MHPNRPSLALAAFLATASLTALGFSATPAQAQARSARDRATARRHLAAYRTKDKAKIATSAKALVAMGERALPSLIEALGDKNKQVRSYVMGTLLRMVPAAIEPLIGALGDRSDLRRSAAVNTLVQIGKGKGVEAPVTKATQSKDPRTRGAAIYILERFGIAPPAGPKQPAQPTTPKPPAQPKQPAQPRQPATPRTPRAALAPEEKALGELSRVSDERHAMAGELLKELEAHVQKGELDAARQLLWGIWAQTKRARYWAGKRIRQRDRRAAKLAAINSIYQRARDLCYGSIPPRGAKDGPVEIETQLQAASVALLGKDLDTTRAILSHVQWRKAGGLTLTPELQAKVNALRTRYDATNKEASQALNRAGMAVINAAFKRKGALIDARVADVAKTLERLEGVRGRSLKIDRQGAALLKRAHQLTADLRKDVAACKAAAAEFARVVASPEWVDRGWAGVLKRNPAADLREQFDALTGGLRAAVYGERLLAKWKARERLGRVYLEHVDASIARSEAAYQKNKDKLAQGELKEARKALEIATSLKVAQGELQRRAARIKEVQASAGVGKLKQAKASLKAAQAALKKASGAHALDDVRRRLSSARAWLAKGKEEGIPAAEAARIDQRLGQAETSFKSAYAAFAGGELKAAEDLVQKASEHLSSGATAYQAQAVLDRATKRCVAVRALLAGKDLSAATKPALSARVAKLEGAIAAKSKQAVESQRLPQDAYTGKRGASWRASFRSLLQGERGWKVLALTIAGKDWKEKTATFDYAGGGNTRIVETRWYRQLFVWAAIADPDDPTRVGLRYLGFRLHKMTDGSYGKLKLYWVEEPVPMLRANLPR